MKIDVSQLYLLATTIVLISVLALFHLVGKALFQIVRSINDLVQELKQLRVDVQGKQFGTVMRQDLAPQEYPKFPHCEESLCDLPKGHKGLHFSGMCQW